MIRYVSLSLANLSLPSSSDPHPILQYFLRGDRSGRNTLGVTSLVKTPPPAGDLASSAVGSLTDANFKLKANPTQASIDPRDSDRDGSTRIPPQGYLPVEIVDIDSWLGNMFKCWQIQFMTLQSLERDEPPRSKAIAVTREVMHYLANKINENISGTEPHTLRMDPDWKEKFDSQFASSACEQLETMDMDSPLSRPHCVQLASNERESEKKPAPKKTVETTNNKSYTNSKKVTATGHPSLDAFVSL